MKSFLGALMALSLASPAYATSFTTAAEIKPI